MALKVSVIIPTYNRCVFLADALESVLHQKPEPFEIIVVDDGSTDRTEEVVRSLSQHRVIYLRTDHGGGAAARNAGIDKARGEYVLWLDSDDVLLPGFMEIYLKSQSYCPDADVFYSNMLVCDKDLNPQKKMTYSDWYGLTSELVEEMIYYSPVSHGGSMVRRSCYGQWGGYNREYSRAHDYELWSRFMEHCTFRHVDVSLYQWRWHEKNMSSGSVVVDKKFNRQIVRNILQRYSIEKLPHNRGAAANVLALKYFKIAHRLLYLEDRNLAVKFAQKSVDSYPNPANKSLLQEISGRIPEEAL